MLCKLCIKNIERLRNDLGVNLPGIGLILDLLERISQLEKEISDAVTYAVCVLADHLDAAAIIAPAQSGRTAIQISRFRPKQPIIVFTAKLTGVRRLSLFRGIYP